MEKTHSCTIVKKTMLCPDTYDFVVNFPQEPKPGQFVHISCGEGVMLRRPMSVCDYFDNNLRFSFAVRGKGTKLLAQHSVGDKLDILGPLGTNFGVDKKGDGVSLVIGGGIGIFPLFYTAKFLGEKTEAILGFRTKDLVIMEDDFNAVCSKTHIVTDDGSYNCAGLVTDIFKERLQKGDITSVYTCGPRGMMKAVAEIAAENDIFCEVSLEERMGCGIGSCAVCVCKIKGKYLKVCQNGPIFNAREVDFDE
ncbi:MAG: dihydroorotate dehydrogenase electron transfer subunit [Firmicutes bacterium]|nr:dihydroorotate dehydrogenase electron transfer subunit [Bacillota bacterium]